MTETIIMVMVPAKITRLSEAANYTCRVMATHVEDDSGVPLNDRVEWMAEAALRTLWAEREDPESLMELMNEEA
jgi:ribonuclease HI